MAEKLHVGVISTSLNFENEIKTAVKQIDGGYTHTAPSMLDIYHKLDVQKMDLLVYPIEKLEDGENLRALVQFFRSKKNTASMPILVLSQNPDITLKSLITDPKVRGFSMYAGVFTPLISMLPIIRDFQTNQGKLTLEADWIQSEFKKALNHHLGQDLDFTTGPANDDETHCQFFCQCLEEARSHLGWFKISGRLLKSANFQAQKIFEGMDEDVIESFSENLLGQVTAHFISLVKEELVSRGAIFFPPIENMSAADRKQLYGGSRSQAISFRSEQLTVMLELIQYI